MGSWLLESAARGHYRRPERREAGASTKWSSAAAGAIAKRDEENKWLKAELGKTKAKLERECKKTVK